MAAIKEIFTIMGVPKILQSDNGGEFKNSILDQYLSKINVRHIFGSPYHPKSQGSVEANNRTIQDFLVSAKDAMGKKFDLKDAINEFLVYYNGRVHSTTGYAPREVVENSNNSDFIRKVKENIIKSRRIKKDKSEKYTVGLKVRVSNYRSLDLEKRFIFYQAPSFVKKSVFKESFQAAGKILSNKRNYCLVKIIQDDKQRKDLKVGEQWKIEKKCLKLSPM